MRWLRGVELVERHMYNKLELMQKANTHACFRMFDQDAKGYITVQDIKNTYAKNEIDIDDDVANEIMYQYDWNHDGVIDCADFNCYLNDYHNFTHIKCSKIDPAEAWPRHATKHMLGLQSYDIPYYEHHNKIMANSTFDDEDMLEQIREKILQKTGGGGMEQYRAFKLFDVRNEGFVKEDGLKVTLEQFGFSFHAFDLMNLFQHFDADGDGVISQKDFTSRVLPSDFGKVKSEDDAKMQKRSLTSAENLIRVVQVEEPHTQHFHNRKMETKARQWLSRAGAAPAVSHGLIHSPRKEGTMTTRGYQYMDATDRNGGKMIPQRPRTLVELR